MEFDVDALPTTSLELSDVDDEAGALILSILEIASFKTETACFVGSQEPAMLVYESTPFRHKAR